MKVTEQYFPVVLFIMFCDNIEPVDLTVTSYDYNKSTTQYFLAVLCLCYIWMKS